MYKAQTVYLPVEITEEFWRKYDSGEERPDYEIIDADNGERLDEWVNRQEGYFFTPEQLNQLLSDVIKDNIEEVIKKGSVWSNGFGEDHDIYVIDYGEEGIRDTFDITFQKHKV